MKEKAKEMLGSINSFWHGLRDNECGGFYGLVDFNLNLNKKAVKGCILNSRILWFFSNAYLTLGDTSCLDDAKHAYNFLREHCIDKENGGVYWSVNYDGSTKDSTKHTYNQAFAIYALSSYYEASKDRDALALAFDLFRLIESKCTDAGGYCESFDRTFKPASNEKLSENGVMAARTMNTLLHVFEAYSGLYHAEKNAGTPTERANASVSSTEPRSGEGSPLEGSPLEIEKCMRKILDIYASKVFNPKLERQEVFFDENMNSIIDLHSYGHDIEASWLMDWGTQLIGDAALSAKISAINSKLADKVLAKAFHNRSIYYECEKGVDAEYREWWAQAEAVVGFLHEYQKHPEKKQFMQAAQDVLSFIDEYLVDKRKGSEWYARVDGSGKPDEKQPIVQPWKCPYHNGRMCFEIIKRC